MSLDVVPAIRERAPAEEAPRIVEPRILDVHTALVVADRDDPVAFAPRLQRQQHRMTCIERRAQRSVGHAARLFVREAVGPDRAEQVHRIRAVERQLHVADDRRLVVGAHAEMPADREQGRCATGVVFALYDVRHVDLDRAHAPTVHPLHVRPCN